MRLSRPRMFFFLNGMIAATLLLYFGSWKIAPATRAFISDPYRGSQIGISYNVAGRNYRATHMRNDIPLRTRYVRIRYFRMAPSFSRIDSFYGIYAEPLVWWMIFFIASSFLLLPDNLVFSKGTVFVLRRSFPYIWMEEYFPVPYEQDEPGPIRRSTGKKKLLDDADQ